MACGTLAILGSLAGAGLSEGASLSEQQKMNSVANQYVNRDQNFAQQARNVFNTSLGQSTPQAAQQQIGQGRQQSLGYTNASQLPSAVTSLPQNVSSPGNNNYQVVQNAKNSLSNQANAGLQGYGNFGLQQYLKDLQSNSQLGLIGNEAQAWNNILPTQLQAAGQSQQGLADAGSLLSTISGLGGLYGATQGPSLASMFGNSQLNAANIFGNNAWGSAMLPASAYGDTGYGLMGA